MNLKATDNLNDDKPVVIVDFVESEGGIWAIIVDEEGAIRCTRVCSLTVRGPQSEALGLKVDKVGCTETMGVSIVRAMRKEMRKGVKFGEGL